MRRTGYHSGIIWFRVTDQYRIHVAAFMVFFIVLNRESADFCIVAFGFIFVIYDIFLTFLAVILHKMNNRPGVYRPGSGNLDDFDEGILCRHMSINATTATGRLSTFSP